MRLIVTLCLLLLGGTTELRVQEAMALARTFVTAEMAAMPGPQRAALGDLSALFDRLVTQGIAVIARGLPAAGLRESPAFR